jgi:hypothetical protein
MLFTDAGTLYTELLAQLRDRSQLTVDDDCRAWLGEE